MTKQIEVRVVCYKGEGPWVAQCVEHDIAAFSRSVKDLPTAIKRAIAANVCVNHDLGREGLEGIPRAPERFAEMVRSGLRIESEACHFSVSDQRTVHIRELVLADAA